MADVVASSILSSVLDKFGQLTTDVGAELKKLEGTLSTIRDVLEDAEARQVQQKALGGWLRRLKDVAYDIDDLLDQDFAKSRKGSAAPAESSTSSWMKGKVSEVLSLPNSFMSQLKIVREIQGIRERLDELAAERSKFHLQERVLVTCRRQEINNRVREETGSFVIESEVYGRKKDKKKIIEFLVDASEGSDLGVIAIVGMGGIGKTTLAQSVYNDRRVSGHFEKKIWVCVSDDFDPKRLVGSMIEHITGNACDLTSTASMQSKLEQELAQKRFLLVLDDVWNENNYEAWDRFRTLLTVGAAGSKIIVTTRSSRAASLMATVEPHFLNALSEDHCWLLFERRAFGIGACCEQTTNLVTIGKEIVKKCGGVPLAAKALGCLMRSKRTESEWSAIRDNDIWMLEENGILPALRLSYNHLPSHLKQCFAYCSIFPKDYVIDCKTLIQLWIAEGFIQPPDKSVESEAVGFQYIEELASRSLFEKIEYSSDYNGLTRIKIHDLVHDLARSASGEECSIIDGAGNRRGIYPITRYSSFIYKTTTLPSILEALDKAKKLRTCYFVKSYGDEVAKAKNSRKQKEEEEKDKMLKILQTVFSNMNFLRALYLTNCAIKELPTTISNLRHLRYLNLSHTCLETLPQSIGLIRSLQILNLEGCKCLKELPDSIGNLTNLLTLDLGDCQTLASLPPSIGHLKSLQTLNLTSTKIEKLPETWCCLSDLRSILLECCCFLKELPGNTKDMKYLTNLDVGGCSELTGMPEGIGRLSRLRRLPSFVLSEKFERGLRELNGLNLEGKLCINKLENVKNFQQATEANLVEKDGLKSLELLWNLNTYKKQMEACARTDDEGKSRQDLIEALAQAEKVLEGLRPHENLTTLYINGYLGKIFPKWLESSLPNLVGLEIHSCIRCATLPDISQLHNLTSLYLCTLPTINSLPPLGQLPSLKRLHLVSLLAIKSLGSEFCGISNVAFPALETFLLECMPELEEWCGVSGRPSFPRLFTLWLLECPKLKALPSAFPSVEFLYMHPDNELLLLSSLQGGAFPNLRRVYLAKLDGTRSSLPQVIAERRSTSIRWSSLPWENSNHDDSDFIKSIAELP